MSFYRTLLAAIAAITIASPVFADDTAMQASSEAAPVATTENTRMQPSASTEQSAAVEVKVNVNKATAKELLKVKGINASKARAIVAYRKKHGEFKSLDDVAKVKALSKLNASDLKVILDQISIS